MRDSIYNAMLDADMNQRYWRSLSDTYARWDQIIRISAAVVACVIPIIDQRLLNGSEAGRNDGAKLYLQLLNAVLAISTTFKFASNSRKCGNLWLFWIELMDDYENLWTDFNELSGNVSRNAMRKKFVELKKKELRGKKLELNFRVDLKLVRRCQIAVRKARNLSVK